MNKKTYEEHLKSCNASIGTNWHSNNSLPAFPAFYEARKDDTSESIFLLRLHNRWWSQYTIDQQMELPERQIYQWRGPAMHIKKFNPLFIGPYPNE